MPPTTQVDTPRIGARVLLLDRHDRVLLIHARDPDQPDHHWWELPGGGQDPGETLEDTAIREVTEETGIQLNDVGPYLWIRESRFHYRNRDHHRIDHIYLGRAADTTSRVATAPSENEKLGLIEHRWFRPDQLTTCPDKLIPPALPTLLHDLLTHGTPAQPVMLSD